MGLNDDIFKHYSIDQGSVEKLLEMWKHFYPKDEPTYTDPNKIYLNKKYTEVTSYQLLFVLAEKIFNKYWLDRFYIQGFELRSIEFMDLLSKKFIEKKDPNPVAKKELFSDIEEESEKPKKERATKKVVKKK